MISHRLRPSVLEMGFDSGPCACRGVRRHGAGSSLRRPGPNDERDCRPRRRGKPRRRGSQDAAVGQDAAAGQDAGKPATTGPETLPRTLGCPMARAAVRGDLYHHLTTPNAQPPPRPATAPLGCRPRPRASPQAPEARAPPTEGGLRQVHHDVGPAGCFCTYEIRQTTGRLGGAASLRMPRERLLVWWQQLHARKLPRRFGLRVRYGGLLTAMERPGKVGSSPGITAIRRKTSAVGTTATAGSSEPSFARGRAGDGRWSAMKQVCIW